MKVKTPKPGEYWGILGGAFDPVHFGHTNLADEILSKLNLDGILFIPSYSHPLKNDKISSSFEHRVNMLMIACKEYDNYSISTIEKKLTGYTIDTIRHLKELYPNSGFIFIVGTDSISQLNQWRSPKEILNEINIIAGTRPGYSYDLDNCFSNKIEYIEINEIDISSTELRKKISNNIDDERLKQFIDKDVIAYIKKNNLYQ